MESFSENKYERLLDEVFVRYPSVQEVGFEGAYKPGLDRMLSFDAFLGHPHRSFRSIHIAGTNGKGSVANMLSSVLSSAGLKTGLFTSPHLLDFRERMRISYGGKTSLVDKEYVYSFLTGNMEEIERLSLSFFEITTALSFKWFADGGVDVGVVETGLGGRLDSTNIITPDLSVVTNIGMDHCDLLGHSLEAIAGEKAGIFKRGVPALVGEVLPETEPVFRRKAEGFCPLIFAGAERQSAREDEERILREMDLRGKYQYKNLRTVLAAVDILKEIPGYEALADSGMVVEAIEHTASRMDFHGRWERLRCNPDVICDIGHNPPALKENFSQLEEMLFCGEYSSLVMVYAVMADKDLDGIMPLMPRDATWIFTAPGIRRALDAQTLQGRYLEFCKKDGRNIDNVYCRKRVEDAVSLALSLCREEKYGPRPLVYVGGSAYLVSAVTPLFMK